MGRSGKHTVQDIPHPHPCCTHSQNWCSCPTRTRHPQRPGCCTLTLNPPSTLVTTSTISSQSIGPAPRATTKHAVSWRACSALYWIHRFVRDNREASAWLSELLTAADASSILVATPWNSTPKAHHHYHQQLKHRPSARRRHKTSCLTGCPVDIVLNSQVCAQQPRGFCVAVRATEGC
jgi:hypothetical protein